MSVLAPRNLWKPIAIAFALLFLYSTVLVKLGSAWWDDPNYSHGLLVPFIIGYILWAERDRLNRAPQRPSLLWGSAMIICGLFALWAGTAGAELYTQRLSLVLLLAGIVVYFWGFRLLRLTSLSFALLVLAIPIPTIVFNKIAFPLQLFASRCAVWAMRMFDIPVLRQGNVIELMPLGARETRKLEVVEACSGIRSLMTLVTLAALFAYFTYPKDDAPSRPGAGGTGFLHTLKSYGFWRSAIIIVASIPIAILTNAMRVSGTGVLARYYGTGVADGFFHSFSGWVIYILAFLLMFAVGWLLDRASELRHRGGGNNLGRDVALGPGAEKSPQTAAGNAPVMGDVAPAKGVD